MTQKCILIEKMPIFYFFGPLCDGASVPDVELMRTETDTVQVSYCLADGPRSYVRSTVIREIAATGRRDRTDGRRRV